MKRCSSWADRERCAFLSDWTIKQIKCDQLRTVEALDIFDGSLCLYTTLHVVLSLLTATALLTASRSRPRFSVSPQPASRWALLMSPSSTLVWASTSQGWRGLWRGGGAERVCWQGQHQAGGWGWDKDEEHQSESWKSHFSALINGEFVHECGKIECEGHARKKVVPQGALWNRSAFCALWSVFIVTDHTLFHLFARRLNGPGGRFPLLYSMRYSRVNNPSFILDEIQEKAVTNESVCLMLPASTFVSRAFDVIETCAFKDTNHLLCSVWPKIKLKGRVRAVGVSTSQGKKKGGDGWGVKGTLMMGWCLRWPQTWRCDNPSAPASAIVNASQRCIQMTSTMNSPHNSSLCHFSLEE